jgi:D-aminoacyl-tRNA deacylase
MKAILQRVTGASVTIDGTVVGCIQDGLLVLLGVAKGDQDSDARFVVDKIRNLRIFSDDHGKMNRSHHRCGWGCVVGLTVHAAG